MAKRGRKPGGLGFNKHFIDGDAARFEVRKRDGSTFWVTVDADDIPRLIAFGRRWASFKPQRDRGKIYIQCADRIFENHVMVRQKWHLLHRFIRKAPEGWAVDHINHDTLDNRKVNLRVVSSGFNNFNRESQGSVSEISPGKWVCGITAIGEHLNLGRFESEDLARAALAGACKAIETLHEKFGGRFSGAGAE